MILDVPRAIGNSRKDISVLVFWYVMDVGVNSSDKTDDILELCHRSKPSGLPRSRTLSTRTTKARYPSALETMGS
jgi:hypothetical protein